MRGAFASTSIDGCPVIFSESIIKPFASFQQGVDRPISRGLAQSVQPFVFDIFFPETAKWLAKSWRII
jgi:hypothetical protein